MPRRGPHHLTYSPLFGMTATIAGILTIGRPFQHEGTEDGVMLLACLEDPGEVLAGLSQRSRGRIRSLVSALDERVAPWASHERVVQALARESLAELRPRLGL